MLSASDQAGSEEPLETLSLTGKLARWQLRHTILFIIFTIVFAVILRPVVSFAAFLLTLSSTTTHVVWIALSLILGVLARYLHTLVSEHWLGEPPTTSTTEKPT